MLQNNIINNVDLSELPDDVVQAMYEELDLLPIKDKLVVMSKIQHGNLIKAERNDVFKINKGSISKTYDAYIHRVRVRLLGE